MKTELPDSWLIAGLRAEQIALANVVAAAREASDAAWQGVIPGWFFDAGPTHGDRVIGLVGQILEAWRHSLKQQLGPEQTCALCCAAYLHGLGLAQRLAERDPLSPWSRSEYDRIEREAPHVSADLALRHDARNDLGLPANSAILQATAVLCRAGSSSGLVSVLSDAAARELRTTTNTPYYVPLLAGLLAAGIALDLAPQRSPTSTALDDLPEDLTLRHLAARCTTSVLLRDAPDGRRRAAITLSLPENASYGDDLERWLERDLARRLRPAEQGMRGELPNTCRLAAMPLVQRGQDDFRAPHLPANVTVGLPVTVARERIVARPQLLQSLEVFSAVERAGAALVQDDCGRESDFPEIAHYIERYAAAQGVPHVVYVNCDAPGPAPVLADVLGSVAHGLGLDDPALQPGDDGQGFTLEEADPGGAGAPGASALARAILGARDCSGVVILANVCRLRRVDLAWLGRKLVAPLLEAGTPPLRLILHGRSKVHNHRLMDFFPVAFGMIGEITPLAVDDMLAFLVKEGGYPDAAAAERAQRAFKLTNGRPLGARTLMQTAVYGQAW